MLKATRKMLGQILADTIDNGLDPTGVYLGLITDFVEPGNKDLNHAQIVEAAYPGYARQALAAFAGAYHSPDGSVAVRGNLLTFQMDDDTTPTTVLGYFLADQAAADDPELDPPEKLLAYEVFDDPVNLVTAQDVVQVAAEIALSPDADMGQAIVGT